MQTRSGRSTTRDSTVETKVSNTMSATKTQKNPKSVKNEETNVEVKKEDKLEMLASIHQELYDMDKLISELQKKKVEKTRLFMKLCANKPRVSCDVCANNNRNGYLPHWSDLPVDSKPLDSDTDHLNGAYETTTFVCHQCKTPGLIYFGIDEDGRHYTSRY